MTAVQIEIPSDPPQDWKEHDVVHLDDTGLWIESGCCGCGPVGTLSSRTELRRLYRALGDWLMATDPGLTEPTTEGTP